MGSSTTASLRCVTRIRRRKRIGTPTVGQVLRHFREEVPMKRYMLALAALTTLSIGTVATANAVEFGVGPDGVYVGPNRGYGYRSDYGSCRTVIEQRTNRFGETVEVRRRICD